jgi:hypothetical protein
LRLTACSTAELVPSFKRRKKSAEVSESDIRSQLLT